MRFKIVVVLAASVAALTASHRAHAGLGCIPRAATFDPSPVPEGYDGRVRQDALVATSCAMAPLTPARIDPNNASRYWRGSDDDRANIVYYNPDNPTHRSSRLLVFFPGRGSRTTSYTNFAMEAAHQGFHVIILPTYNSKTGSNPNVCHTWSDINSQNACAWGLRAYQAFGVPVSPGSWLFEAFRATTPDPFPDPEYNNASHRLLVVLQFLSRNFPDQGWDRYLAGSDVAWGSVVLAGHSNGSGIAAMLASTVEAARLIMFNGPDDYLGGDGTFNDPDDPSTPTTWIAAPTYVSLDHPGGTRSADAYGMTNEVTFDDLEVSGVDLFGNPATKRSCGDSVFLSPTRLSESHTNWIHMGLGAFGGWRDPDCGPPPPYKGTHILRGTLDHTADDSCPSMHLGTVSNCAHRTYVDAWDYLLGTP